MEGKMTGRGRRQDAGAGTGVAGPRPPQPRPLVQSDEQDGLPCPELLYACWIREGHHWQRSARRAEGVAPADLPWALLKFDPAD
jgi:hypothetical protein